MKKFLLAVASAAFFVALSSVGLAQQPGTVANHALPIGKGAGVQGYGNLGPCTNAYTIIGKGASTDPSCGQLDLTLGVTNALPVANGGTGSTGGATARSNLGLAIGTNVEAWDTDLDCIAALSSTGLVRRTGSGTCSAGTVAITDLATGTQDTLIGYFGSTAASATAIPNCSNALAYSTSTHLFSCNSSAGTGTVTSIGLTNTYGLTVSGSPVTASGNISAGVSLTSFTNFLGSDVAMNATPSSYADGPTLTNGAQSGLWEAKGQVMITDTSATPALPFCKLWDGTTVMASGGGNAASGTNTRVSVSLSGTITSPAGNVRISCASQNGAATSGMRANNTGLGKDSGVTMHRIQ